MARTPFAGDGVGAEQVIHSGDLRRHWRRARRVAEDLRLTDPRAACFYARRTLELAVNWLYRHDPALALPYDDNLGALLHDPGFRSPLPVAGAVNALVQDLPTDALAGDHLRGGVADDATALPLSGGARGSGGDGGTAARCGLRACGVGGVKVAPGARAGPADARDSGIGMHRERNMRNPPGPFYPPGSTDRLPGQFADDPAIRQPSFDRVKAAALLDAARRHKMMVVYSTTPTGSIKSVPPVLAPRGEETVVHSGVDKFFGTKLEAALKAKHIHTVIVTGTVAHGAVRFTTSAASLRGCKVAVPVDTLSAPDPFAELSATWILSNAPASVAKNINLTRSDMVQF